MRSIWFFAAVLLLAAAPAHAAGFTAYKTQDCDKAVSVIEKGQCATANAKAAEDALTGLYNEALADQDGQAAKDRLRDAQSAWVAYRVKECAYEIGGPDVARDTRGTLGWACMQHHADQRIAEISKMPGCTGGVSVCTVH